MLVVVVSRVIVSCTGSSFHELNQGDHNGKTIEEDATRANLALSYQAAGHTAEAITLEEQVLADRERILPQHPHQPSKPRHIL